MDGNGKVGAPFFFFVVRRSGERGKRGSTSNWLGGEEERRGEGETLIGGGGGGGRGGHGQRPKGEGQPDSPNAKLPSLRERGGAFLSLFYFLVLSHIR